jgi:hypothetical protein
MYSFVLVLRPDIMDQSLLKYEMVENSVVHYSGIIKQYLSDLGKQSHLKGHESNKNIFFIFATGET